MIPAGCARPSTDRPRFEVAEIFRAHGAAYRARYPLTCEQLKVMRAIENCRTAVLGGHVDVCLDCGHQKPAYNSCRNRHCPKCQGLDQRRWLDARMQTILPVPYFHIVFTVPSELHTIAIRNRAWFFNLLFQAATQSLLTLGNDPKRLGGQLGITAVLHTWTRDLRFHPHIHCIVTGGGLSPDGKAWLDARQNYLFPVLVLGSLFRGKMLDALKRTEAGEELDLPEDLQAQGALAQLRSRLYKKNWNVYAKPPFGGPQEVYRYLGRYTHRVGLSNHRILDIKPDAITISTRGEKTATLEPEEFIRRYLLHVLPRAFVKIRHYGLFASSNLKTRLEVARELLDSRSGNAQESTPDCDQAATLKNTGANEDSPPPGQILTACPACGSQNWVALPEPKNRPPPTPAHSASQ
ncbi:MAG: IS91 family transposase [Rhodospirillales bacterium]|nr:IS91 family transposase [Rhodospirillales bacterium]